MVIYWKSQRLFDAFLALAAALIGVNGPSLGLPVIITLSPDAVILASRAWVAPILTLLGMMSATTAFIFSVVDRLEFQAIRKSKAEPQLWLIFSENLFWLSIAAISAAVISFWNPSDWSPVIQVYVVFLFLIICICILKFAWVMRQIISVRMAQ